MGVTHQDAAGFLAEQTNIQLIITDPPYNIGHDYGPVDDRRSPAEYSAMIDEVMHAAYDALADDGSMFIIHYPQFFAEHWHVLTDKFRCHQWISWVYNSNVGHSGRKFTTAHRAVVWFSKSEDPLFNHKAVTQLYKNPEDRRIKKAIANGEPGTALYDWWNIDLMKNVSRLHDGYANQLPTVLVDNIILSCSSVGDIVCDPFAGTGTVLKRAAVKGRLGVGCDLNPAMCNKPTLFENTPWAESL